MDAIGQVVDAVGCREGKAAIAHQVGAVAGRDILDLHVDTPASDRVLPRALARHEEIVGIVGHVVGATRLIDAKEVEVATAVVDFDTDVIAAYGARPVGDAVGVDLAAEDAN